MTRYDISLYRDRKKGYTEKLFGRGGKGGLKCPLSGWEKSGWGNLLPREKMEKIPLEVKGEGGGRNKWTDL